MKRARIESRCGGYSGEIEKTGTYRAAVDRVATVHSRRNVDRFPIDQQTLEISIEELERRAERLRCPLDQAHMKRNSALEIPGWTITTDRAAFDLHDYGINVGENDGEGDRPLVSSRLMGAQSLIRSSPLAGIRRIIAQVVAIAVLFFAFLLQGSQTSRFSVGATAIFALVSSRPATAESKAASFHWRLVYHQ